MMRRSHSVVRKLTLVVIAIVTLVIAATGLVNNIISNHYTLESAREVLKFNSESILNGINKLMMSRNNKGVLELISDISEGSTVYQEIRLVAHYSGEVAVSRLEEAGPKLREEDPSCAMCHHQSEPAVTSGAPLDEVVALPDGTRILNVITPILNQPSCKNAECHAHFDSGPLLGFLQAEYSLGNIDTLLSGLNTSFVVAGLAAILLGTVALWLMFKETLGTPLRSMVAGIRATAANDLSFRFKTDRNDEFGVVENSFDDMAARIQAHQTELRDAREYLEGIVENSADMILTVNSEGLIQTVNRGAEEALGYERQELIGKPIELLFANPRDREAAIAGLETQDHVANYETRFLTKNKAVRDVLLTLSRLRNREGAAIGTIGISKDITREKELQKLLVQSQTAAAIGQAATAIQHAIKNMLNTLTGGSYLVRRGMAKNDQARIEEGIRMVDEGIATIGSLSLNMLKYAKQWTLKHEVTDLGGLVTDICKAMKQTATDHGIAIQSNLADHLPSVSCDSRLLYMALLDLATNALDACLAKPYTDTETAEIGFNVRLKEDKKIIVVEVTDNGVGMDEQVKANIFKPFFSTKDESGTGLGLALTSRIVKLHGGEIEVESEPERGSRFRIVLPVEGMKANRGAKDGQESRSDR
jgi:PAS domain S-box-containing protein